MNGNTQTGRKMKTYKVTDMSIDYGTIKMDSATSLAGPTVHEEAQYEACHKLALAGVPLPEATEWVAFELSAWGNWNVVDYTPINGVRHAGIILCTIRLR